MFKKQLIVMASILSSFALAEVSVDNCIIQSTIPGAKSTGVFLDINVDKLEDDLALVGARAAEISDVVEIHEMMTRDGVMKMQAISSFPLKEGVNKLEKGGYHIMLMALSQEVEVGNAYPIELLFSDGQLLACDAVAKKPEDIKRKSGHEGHEHHNHNH